jgi:hypothetical protein
MPDETVEALAPVILRMGRHSKKKFKQLRNGHGPLMSRVLDSIDEMKRNGVIPADAPPVIVVVHQKNESFFE